jgi:hypothetical protein
MCLALIETDLIRQGIDVDPYALAVLETSPSFLLKRTSPRWPQRPSLMASTSERSGSRYHDDGGRWPRCTARRDRQVERRLVMLMYLVASTKLRADPELSWSRAPPEQRSAESCSSRCTFTQHPPHHAARAR